MYVAEESHSEDGGEVLGDFSREGPVEKRWPKSAVQYYELGRLGLAGGFSATAPWVEPIRHGPTITGYLNTILRGRTCVG